MLHDFKELIPNLTVKGIDISQYGIENALETVKPFLHTGNASELPYENSLLNLVISINTAHSLPLEKCKQTLREIGWVSHNHTLITIDT